MTTQADLEDLKNQLPGLVQPNYSIHMRLDHGIPCPGQLTDLVIPFLRRLPSGQLPSHPLVTHALLLLSGEQQVKLMTRGRKPMRPVYFGYPGDVAEENRFKNAIDSCENLLPHALPLRHQLHIARESIRASRGVHATLVIARALRITNERAARLSDLLVAMKVLEFDANGHPRIIDGATLTDEMIRIAQKECEEQALEAPKPRRSRCHPPSDFQRQRADKLWAAMVEYDGRGLSLEELTSAAGLDRNSADRPLRILRNDGVYHLRRPHGYVLDRRPGELPEHSRATRAKPGVRGPLPCSVAV